MLLAAFRICARVFARFCFHVRVFAATQRYIHRHTFAKHTFARQQTYIHTWPNIHLPFANIHLQSLTRMYLCGRIKEARASRIFIQNSTK